MSAVECKEPGFYKDFDERTDPGDDFGVETEDFKNGDECSYALGKQVRFSWKDSSKLSGKFK